MKRRLLILNNACFLGPIENQYDEILFAPIYKSHPQKKFFEKRFFALKQSFPRVEWVEFFELSKNDHVLAWDAYNEKKAFGDSLLPCQNRLFSQLPFEVDDIFSHFRGKAEKILPGRFENPFPPFDFEVIDRLEYYFDGKNRRLPSSYFETRNGLTGKNFSTQLSPYLSCGFLDVKYLYNRVKDYEDQFGANKSTYWIIFELLWREFFYWQYQKYQNRFFSKNGIKGQLDFDFNLTYPEKMEFTSSSDLSFFNSAMKELTTSGYLSNRTRQLFASCWINDLKRDWREGASLFESYLLDYDVYSNYGNWMYLAGVGNDPRGKRYFNLKKQLEQYDPNNDYIKLWGA